MKKWRQKLHDNHYLNMIKPGDIIILVLLVLLSFTPLAIFSWQQAHQPQVKKTQSEQLTAYVKHNGKTVYHINLTKHKGKTNWTYRDKDGDYNVITTTGKTIAISSANCRDQVCVRRGKISKPGQTIVCLPHKLLIEIKSNHKGQSTNNGMVTE